MFLQKRERVLGIAAGTILALFAGNWILGLVTGPLNSQRAELTKLEDQVKKQRERVTKGQRAQRRVQDWEAQSLPPDTTVARSFYQNWLAELVERVKLVDSQIQPERGVAVTRQTADRRPLVVCHKLPFTIHGQGSLEQLTRLLYEFYQADFLHQVQSLSIQPLKDSKLLKLTMNVEVLSLPGAEDTIRANRPPADRLALADLKSYDELIVKRNLFAPYTPPPPPRPPRVEVARAPPTPPPPKPPAFDDSKYAFVTAIIEVDDRPEVWLHVRTTGQLLKLHEGDPLHVGAFRGAVTRIGKLDVEIESDGKRRLFGLGDSLRPTPPSDARSEASGG